MKNPVLLKKEDAVDPAKVPAWMIKEYAIFNRKVTTDGFPCHFGTIAEQSQHLRYTYSNRDDWRDLPDTLETFMELSRTHPKVRHALIGFFEPELEEKP